MLNRRVIFLFDALLLGNIVAVAQNQNEKADSKNQDAINRLVIMDRGWGALASTPGTSLSIREASRAGSTFRFRLYTTGLPRGSYTLVAWPVTQRGPSDALKGVTLDDAGMAICAGTPTTCGSSDKPDDPIDLAITPAAGEPFRLGLVSADGKTKVFSRVVPLPLRGNDNSCTVDAVLLTSGSEIVSIEGSGFPKGAQITVESISEGERVAGKGTASSEGKYSSVILPFKLGSDRGTATVTLKAQDCSPSVSFPWGHRK